MTISINNIILDELKKISDDENEYKFLKEVLETCGNYSNKTTSKTLKKELEQLIPIYFPLEVNKN